MDMQKPSPLGTSSSINPSPQGRSSSINPGPGAAVECKTPGVAWGGGCWCLELTDALCRQRIIFMLEGIIELNQFVVDDQVIKKNKLRVLQK